MKGTIMTPKDDMFGSQQKKTSKSEKTRKAIKRAYVDLLETKEFDKIRVSDITRHMDIARSTFYAYFDDTYDVIEKLEDEFLDGMPGPDSSESGNPLQPLGDSGLEKKCSQIDWYFNWLDYVVEHKRLLAALTGPNGNPQFPHKLRSRVRELWRTQVNADGFYGDLENQNFFLRMIADTQLRCVKDLVKDSADTDYLKKHYAYLMYILRLGAWYDRTNWGSGSHFL